MGIKLEPIDRMSRDDLNILADRMLRCLVAVCEHQWDVDNELPSSHPFTLAAPGIHRRLEEFRRLKPILPDATLGDGPLEPL